MTKPILAAILSCEGTTLTDREKYLFSEYNPLGISLFTRNVSSQKQLKRLIAEIKGATRDDILIAVDEEGGRVSRLPAAGFSRYASAEVLGMLSEEYSTMQAALIATDLREVGINVNYAPVIDKRTKPQNKVLESRCFSDNNEDIVNRATAMAETYMAMGICPCIKHIPGHFSALADPHLSSLETTLSRDEIEKEVKYQSQFKKFPLAMTSHIILKAWDAENPVTQSSAVISELIRSFLEFDGFLLSDAIDMHALKGNIAERAQCSWNAGVDAVCCCSGRYDDLQAVCSEKRFLTEKARIRFAKIKKVIHNTPKYKDVENIRKRYNQELEGKLNAEYSYDATEVLHQMLKKGENV